MTQRLDPVRLSEFEVGEPIGSGAMARVFAAVEKKTGRVVALKLLDAAARGSRELRERMAREAVFLASLESPYVSRLLGYGWEGDQPFLVLEKLEGETLAALLRREKRLSPARLVDWVEQLLVGLRDCHAVNVIHRDIKPANIFMVQSPGGDAPVVKLIDFGVARLGAIASAGASLTSTHHLIGSMGYMAPEQLEYAKGVGPSADLYAVGVVVFRSLTGRLPFVARSFEAIMRLKAEATAPPVSSLAGGPPNDLLDEFVARALCRDPEARFASAPEMLRAWWQVAAALERDTELPEVDVVFDEDEWVSTLATSVSASGPRVDPTSSTPLAAVVRSLEKDLENDLSPVVRDLDGDLDMATDPQMTRPSEGTLRAALEREPGQD